MFEFVVRPIYNDTESSAMIIADGQHPNWMCQDWQCPKSRYCARHFGLSKTYAAMADLGLGEALVTPARGADGCGYYTLAKRDHFSESIGQPRFLGKLAVVK